MNQHKKLANLVKNLMTAVLTSSLLYLLIDLANGLEAVSWN